MEQWNSESGTVWWNNEIVMVEQCSWNSGTVMVEQWKSDGEKVW